MYDFWYCVGFFSVFIILMVIELIKVRRGKSPWAWYGIGFIVYDIVLITLTLKPVNAPITMLWIVFVLLLLTAAVLIKTIKPIQKNDGENIAY